MTETGLDSFDETIQETNKLLKDIMGEFNFDIKDRAYVALRAVIQTLRDRMTDEEVVDFGAQLPMLVRGFYYEGWRIAKTPKDMDRQQFMDEVRKKFPFQMEQTTEDLIRGVLLALTRYVSRGEFEDIEAILPKRLKPIIAELWS